MVSESSPKNEVKGKSKLLIYIINEVESERERFVHQHYGPGVVIVSPLYQAAMIEYLRNRGYCLDLPARKEKNGNQRET